MAGRAESWLRDLQSAVATRRLYPPDHPRNLDSLGELEEHARALTKDRPTYSVLDDADRLVSDDGVVESPVPLARGVFDTLKQHGFARLTIARGVSRRELAGLVAQLAAQEPGSHGTPLTSSDHISFSRLVWTGHVDQQAAHRAGAGAVVPLSLPRLWESVDRGAVEMELLEALVLALGHTASLNHDSLIPLMGLQSHDAYTVTHITNVAIVAMALASSLGFNSRFVQDVATAALLHDIGKLKVPPELLTSARRLSDTELAQMKRHPEDGARLLMGMPRIPDMAPIVAFEHHLHHGGGGYPSVPPGWRIHIASEITHVADVYDALRSDRPYRRGLPPEEVARMMTADSGTVFDPLVLEVFFERVAPRLTQEPTSDPVQEPDQAALDAADAPAVQST